MIYDIKGVKYTDNSHESCEQIVFVKTQNNQKYQQEAIDKGSKVVELKEFSSLISLDDISIIGITGTNGKTTTAAAIYSILLDLDFRCALQGTRGFFINDEKINAKSLTTPSIFETMCHIHKAKQSGCSYFVMEVSSHAIAQNRIQGLNFALKAHTNITQDHLDYHVSLQEYIRVKNSFLQDESLKVINKDDKRVDFNYKNAYTYAIDNPASFVIPAYSLKDGIKAAVKHFDEICEFSSPMHGIFNISNLLCAISAVKLLTKLPLQDICNEVENFAGVSGRMEIVSQNPLVIVDFAHTPDGMYRVFEALNDKTLSVVFGAGGDRDKDKRPKMGAVASRFAKKIYITSDNPRSENPKDIANDILDGIKDKRDVKVQIDRTKAIKLALDELEPHESLLILGKGDEDTQEINGEFFPYDDRKVVRKLLDEI